MKMMLLAALILATACGNNSSFPNSGDGRYRAEQVQRPTGTQYQVVEVATKRVVLTTAPQYPTPNPVKAGGFSPDSKKFAAVYHYSHNGGYTYIGIWSTETGEFLRAMTEPGETTSLNDVFEP